MIKKSYYILLSVLLLSACGSFHRINKNRHTTFKKTKVDNSVSGRARTVLNEAHYYFGTPYKYGGTTKKGMDCSGLLWNSYQKVNIQLPRVSREQAEYGMKVKLKNVQPGDAVFFNTSGSGISHAGIVDRVSGGEIFFIHASSSKGVMVSSLEEPYWKKRFVKAVRYLH
ncbi:NlpC/P60 family protein [Ornithobacterium rhinotracheale]|uniref:C40 family peptidase n=1 Tax=Ornithobacterium rhinotracheale TaxID=28251 RepID=UPI00129D1697|nr:C40 family peptidase [Ornithobacterium rhinotracheale]MRI63850.1 NlpC/P60 family protein [Ornithobacterium rhinotracheale]MRJ08633.1 NlpC/P60 family protein [Ornithobacterium rhinotracheale]UOH76920.1 C40 family peptidase [Ornithobacterium rhinotracheale]